MRTRTWLLALGIPALGLGLVSACGDTGGTGGSTTTSTSTSTTTSSSSSSSSSSSGAGGAVMATDTCPGGLVTLTPSVTPVVVSGTTTGAKNDYQEQCVPGSTSPDVVYEVDVTSTCTLDMKLTEAQGFDGVLSVRRTVCDMRQGGDICVNQLTHTEEEKLEVLTGDKIYVVVDGANNTSGDYSLSFTCTDPACGDGVINTEEQCEPSGPNDPTCGQPGTVNACKILEAPAADTCAGAAALAIDIPLTQHMMMPVAPAVYNTIGSHDDYLDSNCGAAGGNDEVFQLVPQSSGKLTVMIGRDETGTFSDLLGANSEYCQPPNYDNPGCWTRNIYLRAGATCDTATTVSPTGCNPTPTAFALGQPAPVSQCGWQCSDLQAVNIITADVTGGTPIWLFVDGQGPSAPPDGLTEGKFVLHFKLE